MGVDARRPPPQPQLGGSARGTAGHAATRSSGCANTPSAAWSAVARVGLSFVQPRTSANGTFKLERRTRVRTVVRAVRSAVQARCPSPPPPPPDSHVRRPYAARRPTETTSEWRVPGNCTSPSVRAGARFEGRSGGGGCPLTCKTVLIGLFFYTVSKTEGMALCCLNWPAETIAPTFV